LYQSFTLSHARVGNAPIMIDQARRRAGKPSEQDAILLTIGSRHAILSVAIV
jgi:hypothetical protein